MQNLKESLKSIGLTEKERDVYLAVLTLGKGTVTDIAKKSGLKRTSIYQYMEALLQKNFVSQTRMKKRIFYIAEHPKNILAFLKKKKTALETAEKKIENILPDLESLYSVSSTKPTVLYYEGKEGLRFVYETLAKNHRQLFSFFSPRKFFTLFSYQDNDTILSHLEQNGGMLRNLIEKSDATKKRLSLKKYNSFVKNKTLPAGFTFDTDVLIADTAVAFISFDKKIAVIIYDNAVARFQKNIFLALWKQC